MSGNEGRNLRRKTKTQRQQNESKLAKALGLKGKKIQEGKADILTYYGEPTNRDQLKLKTSDADRALTIAEEGESQPGVTNAQAGPQNKQSPLIEQVYSVLEEDLTTPPNKDKPSKKGENSIGKVFHSIARALSTSLSDKSSARQAAKQQHKSTDNLASPHHLNYVHPPIDFMPPTVETLSKSYDHSQNKEKNGINTENPLPETNAFPHTSEEEEPTQPIKTTQQHQKERKKNKKKEDEKYES